MAENACDKSIPGEPAFQPAGKDRRSCRNGIEDRFPRQPDRRGWFLTGEMLELIQSGAGNIVCTQPFACLPNHVVGKGVIKELRRLYPHSNIVAIDFDPGASEVNQLNRIKLMLSTANKNLQAELEKEQSAQSDL